MVPLIPVAIILVAAAGPVHAQTSASIEGVIRDPTGAVVASVVVEASAAHIAAIRTTTAGSDGTYRLLGLSTGVRWEVRAQSDGFAEQRRVVEALAAGEHRVLDFELRPASVNAQVTVTGELPIGRTTTPELGGAVSRQQIDLLPVNGRELIRLAYLVPGAVGGRWDYDSVTDTPVGHPDVNNVAPRLGFSWTPGGNARHQVRGGYGIFYERIAFAVYSDTIFNNPNGGAISVTFAPGTRFAPPKFPSQLSRDVFSAVSVSQLPPRDVRVFGPDLKSPWNQQLSIGYVCVRSLLIAHE